MSATSVRSGPFWDAVEGRAPLPRAAATLGLEFVAADVENGTIGSRLREPRPSPTRQGTCWERSSPRCSMTL